MKNKIKLAIVHFIGMAASLLASTAAHYVYDYYPGPFTSLFFPVNESMWEHTKLFVLPVLLVYLVIFLIIGRKFKNYIPATFLSVIYMPLFSSVGFQICLMISAAQHNIYTIIFYALTLTLGFTISYLMAVKDKPISKIATVIIVLGVVALLVNMIVFTYYPPKAQWLKWLFMDSKNSSYGITQ